MDSTVNANAVYVPSEEIVAREIQGEFIIVPITSGIGDLEDDIFSLNETARSVWGKLDGKRNIKEVIADLKIEFEGCAADIEKDVVGLVAELLRRRMLVEAKRG